MEEHKVKWLESLGLADAKSVKDCDMFASFDKGKQSEHKERRHFTEAATLRAAA